MRTFVLRARKATVQADKLQAQLGSDAHVEIIAHTLANAFYYSNGMRSDVEVYVVMDSAPDFPRTLRFNSQTGLSFDGFHEHAILDGVALALKAGADIAKGAVKSIAPGISIHGYGFDTLMKSLIATRPVYLLDKKGNDARQVTFKPDAVFLLSDHLAMPKNSITVLERQGLHKISLGKRMLFASQCVVLINHELDRQAA